MQMKMQQMKKFMKLQNYLFCDEFIEKFPNKYETLIGENGVRLSGGEKQRFQLQEQ